MLGIFGVAAAAAAAAFAIRVFVWVRVRVFVPQCFGAPTVASWDTAKLSLGPIAVVCSGLPQCVGSCVVYVRNARQALGSHRHQLLHRRSASRRRESPKQTVRAKADSIYFAREISWRANSKQCNARRRYAVAQPRAVQPRCARTRARTRAHSAQQQIDARVHTPRQILDVCATVCAGDAMVYGLSTVSGVGWLCFLREKGAARSRR